ncbi:Holliday junction ATP-dependent DNA helicase RuvA [Verrucomicrobiota bacterium]|jgi:Holliday junction DNA helicase RuvA|nr:Holliday junction ATP-dependent DNA helicase RuvA [Verrucomicrobiota bacterium]GDY17802.1 Holliday junction ATP-dependent DNA helicase RuvA [Verrucomicrobiota bacterium]
MIVSLRGKLIEAGVLRVVIESAGVGYEVNVPVTTAERLPKLGAEVFLLIHHVFREDGQALYGFAVAEEREFFKLLVEKVSGVGPKMALNILSRLSLPILRDAILRGDVALLSQCPGVGKKTAERLVMELKDKVGLEGSAPSVATLAPAAALAPTPASDALAALVALGFKPADADKGVRTAVAKLGPGATADQLVKAALGR